MRCLAYSRCARWPAACRRASPCTWRSSRWRSRWATGSPTSSTNRSCRDDRPNSPTSLPTLPAARWRFPPAGRGVYFRSALMFENLLLTREGDVALLTINRPQVLNALNIQTLDELRRAMLDVQADASVRAV